MLKTLKRQNGFTGADIVVSLAIITLFTGLIVTIAYNIYLVTNAVKRTSTANSYIVDVFEQVDRLYYDDVIKEKLADYFNEKYYYEDTSHTALKENAMAKANNAEGEDVPYQIEINVTTYGEDEGKLDLVKTIEMSVKYNIGSNKGRTVTAKRIKKREILISPNAPVINDLKGIVGNKEIALIKYINGTYEVCEVQDLNWYNYDNGNWALALVLADGKTAKVGDKIQETDIDSFGKIYFWVPRYSYKNTDVEFIYGNQDSILTKDENDYQKIEGMKSDYEIPNNFNNGSSDNKLETNKRGLWLENDSSSDAGTIYGILNSSQYKRKNI